ncbi:MAG: MerR family transcriptional regulator [Hyphomicrobiales bacterium]|nr:MAG: MerR family transcriptional regulator [Hyphomicrobiales bacterium]
MDSKSPDAFRTISEVADDLDLPQHVLRFWETRFSQIKPMKRGGGRRYYRPDDVELLRGIRHLLYGEGYTIKGVQRILREQGVRFVMDAPTAEEDTGVDARPAPPEAVAPKQAPMPAGKPASPGQTGRLSQAMHAVEDTEDSDVVDTRSHPPAAEPVQTKPAAPVQRTAAKAAPAHAPLTGPVPHDDDVDAFRPEGKERPPLYVPAPDEPLPRDVRPDDDGDSQGKRAFRLMDRLRGDRGEPQGPTSLSRDEVRRLQATLFELLECKRLLDQAR